MFFFYQFITSQFKELIYLYEQKKKGDWTQTTCKIEIKQK